ncbi:MAG TPA: class I SAM-dependent methyltransferase [Panacibacter sp.]|nr:class I SAM-dependent methyltransferase [Panacibacter sp.]HNP45899.1 class I SAM-dependent methyltransferase [Panacibacter sp.]
MYSSVKLGIKFIRYWFSAENGKGHGVHSPFVFDFISKVLNDEGEYYCYNSIEQLREDLLKNTTLLELEDFGAGSRMHASYKRRINEIALSSLKPRKFARLLFRMVNYYQPDSVLELGTSLGITTAYLASADEQKPVTTMEGAKAVAALAGNNFKRLGLKNVSIIEGNFDYRLPQFIKTAAKVDFVYVDGNHRKEPTLKYFELLLEKIHDNSIIVFDDVHWSSEMEAAWDLIKAHSRVTLSIDLFFVGIVFFRPEQKIKQDFVIRF